MVVKDLGFSDMQLKEFLMNMEGVKHVGMFEFNYMGKIHIMLKRKHQTNNDMFNIERCFMELSGDSNEIENFYYKFLINHVTMGG